LRVIGFELLVGCLELRTRLRLASFQPNHLSGELGVARRLRGGTLVELLRGRCFRTLYGFRLGFSIRMVLLARRSWLERYVSLP
jgi:hypothetical protein